MNAYEIGEVIVLRSTWKKWNGATGQRVLTDPTTLTVTVKPLVASATVFTLPATITKIADGIFEAYFTVAEAGVHEVRAEGTGAAAGAKQGQFSGIVKNTP